MATKKLLSSALALVIISANANAAEPALTSAPANAGKLLFEARWRLEDVNDDAFAKGATADTVRLRLGYKTAAYQGWSGVLELEATQHLFSDDFNSTANGNTGYPTIADPDNVELNQAYVSYAPSPAGKFILGRQRIIYDNQRFFGNVGWRQNEQTFDGFDAQYKFGKAFNVRYSYLYQAHRIFGDESNNPTLADWDLNANLIHADYPVGPGVLTGYAHFIENKTLPLTSHENFGIRYAAKHDAPEALGWLANAEYAQQNDYADGSSAIDADYTLLEGGMVWKGSTFKAGWEQLGGDGHYGFATPFATLHAFNGWADRFLTTPVNGLQDSYLSWNRKFGKLGATVAWHDFQSDVNSIHYGQELDASMGYTFNKHWNGMLKLADYQAKDIGFDVTKLWLSMEYVY